MGIFIVVLIVVALVAVFSVQNAAPVAISFLFWRFEASLAVVLFLSLLTGIVATAVADLLLRAKSSRRKRAAGVAGNERTGAKGKGDTVPAGNSGP